VVTQQPRSGLSNRVTEQEIGWPSCGGASLSCSPAGSRQDGLCRPAAARPAGTKPLVDIVGLPRVVELCLTRRMVGAAEARELRLAELVVPGADLDTAVAGLVASLLAPDPATVRAVKKLLAGAPARTLEEQAAAERTAQAALQRERGSGGST